MPAKERESAHIADPDQSVSDPIPWTCNLESHHVSASRRRGVDAHKSDDLRACVSSISVQGE
jgi:hypothetical protein